MLEFDDAPGALAWRHSKMTTEPSPILDLRAFVPAKDYARSKQFYLDLGFTLLSANDDVAQFKIGGFGFLLQNYYVEQWAANFMMSLMVEDADAWWRHINDIKLAEKYPGIMCKAPAMQPWGLRVLYLSDPAGVLWHIAEGA
jgi:uncharacterized glyoxalase superfamily protein PhnB